MYVLAPVPRRRQQAQVSPSATRRRPVRSRVLKNAGLYHLHLLGTGLLHSSRRTTLGVKTPPNRASASPVRKLSMRCRAQSGSGLPLSASRRCQTAGSEGLHCVAWWGPAGWKERPLSMECWGDLRCVIVSLGGQFSGHASCFLN